VAQQETMAGTTLGFGSITVGFVLLVLWLVLRRTVLRPVTHLGNIAERVGQGDLGAKANLSSSDEIGRLGARLNDMVGGLRQRLALSKFVSAATLESVSRDSHAQIARQGQRVKMTVLFSDIRGFTSYSENHQPEEVVAMLNEYLHVQADKVREHAGDIDKFVGDELMARFDGEGAERRAVLAALDMVDAVHALAVRLSQEPGGSERKGIEIGVGVNAGDMILGAMGHAERMDFTVIGDAVNLGARLCSAAKPGQVLLTEATAQAAGFMDDVEFEPLEPIAVKGKKDPIAIVAAKRVPRQGSPKARTES
jgi:adenylate cyclase